MSKIHLRTGKGCFTYEAGTTLEAISRDFQKDYPHDIILAHVDGKLAELNSCMRLNLSQPEKLSAMKFTGEQPA